MINPIEYISPYPDGWRDKPSAATPIDASALQRMDNAIRDLTNTVNQLIAGGGSGSGGELIDDDAASGDSVYSSAKVEQLVSAQVASLVGAAPSALNALNELAAAIGNDPNFATSIVAQLAAKQPADADLTAISGLATTAFGRNLLTATDAASILTMLGLTADQIAGNIYAVKKVGSDWIYKGGIVTSRPGGATNMSVTMLAYSRDATLPTWGIDYHDIGLCQPPTTP